MENPLSLKFLSNMSFTIRAIGQCSGLAFVPLLLTRPKLWWLAVARITGWISELDRELHPQYQKSTPICDWVASIQKIHRERIFNPSDVISEIFASAIWEISGKWGFVPEIGTYHWKRRWFWNSSIRWFSEWSDMADPDAYSKARGHSSHVFEIPKVSPFL